MHIPRKKPELIREAEQEVMEVQRQYEDGLITQGERYNKVIDIWAQVTEKVANEMMEELGSDEAKEFTEEELKESRSFNSIYMMADSGARGSTAQIRQLPDERPHGETLGRDHRDSYHRYFREASRLFSTSYRPMERARAWPTRH